MRIYVNGEEAFLPANASFEYVSENPLFTEAEGYSLEITFPMKGCAGNIGIFGALHVPGVDVSTVTYPCEIRDSVFHKKGILTILSVSEREVKAQFLEGISRQNFASSIPDVYLTDLDFSAYDGSDRTAESIRRVNGLGWDRLVVWDSNTDRPVYTVEGAPGADPTYHTHIYLWHLVELVGKVCNMTIDTSVLDKIWIYRHAIVCNTMDGYRDTYPPLSRVLPHWTVKEFFRQIGNFFGCIVDIDDYTKAMAFRPCSSMLSDASSGNLQTLTPLDDFSVELQDSDNTYRGNVGFKLPDACNPDNRNMCAWLLEKEYLYDTRYTNKSEFKQWIRRALYGLDVEIGQILGNDTTLYYLTDIQQYAVITDRTEVYINNDQEAGDLPDYLYTRFDIINQYGDFTEGEELGIAPCPIEIKSMWILPTLNGEYDYDSPRGEYTLPYKFPVIEMIRDKKIDASNNDQSPTSPVLDVLSAGEENETEYYDKLWLVLHSGVMQADGSHVNTRKYEPLPFSEHHLLVVVQKYEGEMPIVTTEWKEYTHTLSPADSSIQANARLPKVDESKLYRYKFLSRALPSSSDIYLIHGRKYACIRLTAHFTTRGMSELIEGEFYRIVD